MAKHPRCLNIPPDAHKWGMAAESLSGYVTALLLRAKAQHARAAADLADLTGAQVRAALLALAESPPAVGATVTPGAVRDALEAAPQARQRVPEADWLDLHHLSPTHAAALGVLAFERAHGRCTLRNLSADTSAPAASAPAPTESRPSTDFSDSLLDESPDDLWGIRTRGAVRDADANHAEAWTRRVKDAYTASRTFSSTILAETQMPMRTITTRMHGGRGTRTFEHTVLSLVALLRRGAGLPDLLPLMPTRDAVVPRVRWAVLCLWDQNAKQAAIDAGYNSAYLRVCEHREAVPKDGFLRGLASSDVGRAGGLSLDWLRSGKGDPLPCRPQLLGAQERPSLVLETSGGNALAPSPSGKGTSPDEQAQITPSQPVEQLLLFG